VVAYVQSNSHIFLVFPGGAAGHLEKGRNSDPEPEALPKVQEKEGGQHGGLLPERPRGSPLRLRRRHDGRHGWRRPPPSSWRPHERLLSSDGRLADGQFAVHAERQHGQHVHELDDGGIAECRRRWRESGIGRPILASRTSCVLLGTRLLRHSGEFNGGGCHGLAK
jgi:hypothetical protein